MLYSTVCDNPLGVLAKMDMQDDQLLDLLNDVSNVCEDVFHPSLPIVPGPADPKAPTNDEVHLALLHCKIKNCAIIPLNPKFNAMPRQEYRPFKLCLPKGFKPSALAFFKLFFSDCVTDSVNSGPVMRQ
jgi:hypothetical protein